MAIKRRVKRLEEILLNKVYENILVEEINENQYKQLGYDLEHTGTIYTAKEVISLQKNHNLLFMQFTERS